MVTELKEKKTKGEEWDDGIVDGGPSRAQHKGGQRTKKSLK